MEISFRNHPRDHHFNIILYTFEWIQRRLYQNGITNEIPTWGIGGFQNPLVSILVRHVSFIHLLLVLVFVLFYFFFLHLFSFLFNLFLYTFRSPLPYLNLSTSHRSLYEHNDLTKLNLVPALFYIYFFVSPPHPLFSTHRVFLHLSFYFLFFFLLLSFLFCGYFYNAAFIKCVLLLLGTP